MLATLQCPLTMGFIWDNEKPILTSIPILWVGSYIKSLFGWGMENDRRMEKILIFSYVCLVRIMKKLRD